IRIACINVFAFTARTTIATLTPLNYVFPRIFGRESGIIGPALVYSGPCVERRVCGGRLLALRRAGHLLKVISRVCTPTKNRRLNELIGFLLLVSAAVLFLALASYSPLDPSLNTSGSQAPRNWIGLFGAVLSDLLLQSVGVCVFLLPLVAA